MMLTGLGLDLIGVHNELVKRNIPKERLLVIPLQDLDWEPICKFLDKPIPNEPFPRANDGAAADKVAAAMMAGLAIRWIALLTTAAAGSYLAYRLATEMAFSQAWG
jgi:hypothetical protein